MKVKTVFLACLLLSGSLLAKDEAEITLIEKNDILTQSQFDDSLTIHAVDVYQKSEGLSVDQLDDLLVQASQNLNNVVELTKEKFGYEDSTRSQRALTKIESISKLMDEFIVWARDNEISDGALAIRKLYAIAKFDVAFELFVNAGESKRYYMDVDSFISQLDLNMSCDLFMTRTNESVDAFFNTMFLADGKLNTSKLANLIDAPFNCPVAGMAYLNYTMSDLVTNFDYFKRLSFEHMYLDNLDKPNEKEQLNNKEIVKTSEYSYQSEIERLSLSKKPRDILLLALLKHVFEKPKDITEISNLLESIPVDPNKKGYINDYEINHYDGTDLAMTNYLNHYSLNQFSGFTVPCSVFIENNYFLRVLNPQFADQRDNYLPKSGCKSSDYPLPVSFNEYLEMITLPTNDWLVNYQGSLQSFYYKLKRKEKLNIQVFPRLLKQKKEFNSLPFETWSYLNLENRKIFDQIKHQYEIAYADLTEHYIANFKMTKQEAQKASRIALNVSINQGHWGESPVQGLLFDLLNNVSSEKIISNINSVDDLNDLEPSILQMKYYGGAWNMVGDPDPLIMMAVNRPDILKVLLEKNNSFQYKKIDNYNETKRSNPQTNVNAKNEIGKNALHAAVQQNQLESVKILIEAGIDTGAIVSDRDLQHNNRSVAMYAAANADLTLIKYLIEQGVDFNAVDSKGFGVLSYLFGVGVLDMNPHLTLENLEEYIEVLQPNYDKYQGQKISPRFNCELAGNFSEELACSNSYIAVLDRMLLIRYKTHLSSTDDEKALRNDQRNWVKMKNACSDQECVQNAYETRLDQLK